MPPMIEPKPHPTRLTRWMAGLARWSLGLVLAFWLVLGSVWGVLHGWIVPRIGEWRPQLESLASRTLGLPVRIGSITARSEGRSEEHTSELQSPCNLVCRLLLEKKKKKNIISYIAITTHYS